MNSTLELIQLNLLDNLASRMTDLNRGLDACCMLDDVRHKKRFFPPPREPGEI